MRIDLASAALGAVGGLGLFGLLSLAQPQQATLLTRPIDFRLVNPVDVVGIGNPRNIVEIQEGTQYVVPTGKVFWLSSLGSGKSTNSVTLKVDGVDQVISASGSLTKMVIL